MIKILKSVLVLSLMLFTAYSFAGTKIYIPADIIDLTRLLPPPPAQDSKATAAEIAEILNFQDKRSPEMTDYARKDQVISVFRFATVLGDNFNETNLPLTAKFFENIHATAGLIVDHAKDYWKRPRPSVFDSRVKPCVSIPANGAYPSGHSTAGNLFAIILANMIPEKSELIFNRGWEFGMNRVIGGVHYRSDVDAGRTSATIIAYELFQNAEFQNDYDRSRTEIRKLLGLN
jgi:acid phosphatase (class A)